MSVTLNLYSCIYELTLIDVFFSLFVIDIPYFGFSPNLVFEVRCTEYCVFPFTDFIFYSGAGKLSVFGQSRPRMFLGDNFLSCPS